MAMMSPESSVYHDLVSRLLKNSYGYELAVCANHISIRFYQIESEYTKNVGIINALISIGCEWRGHVIKMKYNDDILNSLKLLALGNI